MNTEARAQIFSHAFGFKQKAFDFGIDFEANTFEMPPSETVSPRALSGYGTDKDGQVASSFNGLVKDTISSHDRQFRLSKPVPDEIYTGNEVFLTRQFVLCRMRSNVSVTEMEQ